MKNANQIYQLKVSLLDTQPTIWRRIQVHESYDFSDLHCAIQKAMGWENSHLYEFTKTTRNAILEHSKINDVFSSENNKVYYEYDFGDGWLHEVLLEKILPAANGELYPTCITGAMACPPEDCGGIPGYYRLVEIMKNHKHKEYRSMIEWLGNEFVPENFDPKKVSFDSE